MKTVFINAKYAGKIDLEKIGKLPKKVGLVASIQFVSLLKDVEKYLAKQGIKTLISPGNQKNLGQILGCNASAAVDLKEKVEAFLYIGDGRFHPIAVGMKTGKQVFTFNPISGSFKKLDDEVVERYKKKKKVR